MIGKKTLAVFGLFFASFSAGEGIYKWIDDAGCMHYGDSPPYAANAQELSVGSFSETTTPSSTHVSGENAPEESAAGVAISVDTSDAHQPTAYDAREFRFSSASCLDSIESLLDPEKSAETGSPAIFAPLTPRKLEKSEVEWLDNFLPHLSRRWSGDITEIICVGPDRAVREKRREWKVIAEGSWSSSGFLDLRFDRTRDDGTNRRESMAISIRNDQFRFRSGLGPKSMASSSSSFSLKPPTKCDDIELLSVDRNGVSFFTKYRRRTGPNRSLQVQDVYSFRVMDRSFQLDQATYVQGRLVGKSTWRLHR